MESHRKCGNCESVSFIEAFMVDSMNDKVNTTTVCLLCKFPLRLKSGEEVKCEHSFQKRNYCYKCGKREEKEE